MFTGYNSDVELDGKAFHVQTEDKGLDNPVVETRVYRGGEVVASVLTSYADLADSPDYSRDRIRHRMQEQHQSLIEDLRMGRLEAEPTVRREALARVLDPDNLVEEYVEDWIEASNLTAPIHQALERGIDAIQKKEVEDLSKKKAKKTRTNLALLVVLISVYASFELGRLSQNSAEPRADLSAPPTSNAASIPVIGPAFGEHVDVFAETGAPPETIEASSLESVPVVDADPVEEMGETDPLDDTPALQEPVERQPEANEFPPPPSPVTDDAVEPVELPELDPPLEEEFRQPAPIQPEAGDESAPPEGPFEIDQVDRAPTSVATQLPVYTPAALRAAREGSVRMKVLVGTDGSIDAVRMLDEITDSDLNKAAISAILHWRFEAGSHRGKAVSVWVPVRLDFSLSQNQMRSVVTVTR